MAKSLDQTGALPFTDVHTTNTLPEVKNSNSKSSKSSFSDIQYNASFTGPLNVSSHNSTTIYSGDSAGQSLADSTDSTDCTDSKYFDDSVGQGLADSKFPNSTCISVLRGGNQPNSDSPQLLERSVGQRPADRRDSFSGTTGKVPNGSNNCTFYADNDDNKNMTINSERIANFSSQRSVSKQDMAKLDSTGFSTRSPASLPLQGGVGVKSSNVDLIFGNVQSIGSKIKELSILATEHRPAIIGLCECYTNDNISDAFLNVENYNLICRRDGKGTTNGKCRGLLVYVREDISASEFSSPDMEKFEECCGVEIDFGKTTGKIKIILCYRPPAALFTNDNGNGDNFTKMLDNLDKNVIIVGDFNMPGIEWDLLYSSSKGERTFIELFQKKFWTQHVNFQTHNKGNLLDVCLTDRNDLIGKVEDIGPIGKSDHTLIKVELNVANTSNKSKELRPQFHRADFDKIKGELVSINWENELKDLDTNQCWEKFRAIQDKIIAQYVPFAAKKN